MREKQKWRPHRQPSAERRGSWHWCCSSFGLEGPHTAWTFTAPLASSRCPPQPWSNCSPCIYSTFIWSLLFLYGPVVDEALLCSIFPLLFLTFKFWPFLCHIRSIHLSLYFSLFNMLKHPQPSFINSCLHYNYCSPFFIHLSLRTWDYTTHISLYWTFYIIM